MKLQFTVVAVILGVQVAAAADAPTWVEKPALTFNAEAKTWTVSFELNAPTDVEVAIVAPDGAVVRHLAAGVLGKNPPPPLVSGSAAQRITWDGRDDYGEPAPNPEKMAARVRAGMRTALEQIVGGDPYAYYSEEMGDNDHSPWGIAGVVATSDNKVCVWGHSSNLGPPALRQYDVNGNYERTLYPLPAGRDPNEMKGWGLNLRADGTYVPRFSTLVDPSPTTTFLDGNLDLARLVETPHADRLTFLHTGLRGSFDLLAIHRDGRLAENPQDYRLGPLVKEPPFRFGPIEPNSHIVHSMVGPTFLSYTPDGKAFYLSGLCAATTIYGTLRDVPQDGFWRDGQVWKVDAQTRKASVFFALERESLPALKNRTAAYGGSTSYAALHGVAVARDGHVLVCDRLNKRLVILDPQGKKVREIPVAHADALALHEPSGALYVTTREGDHYRRGVVRLLKFNNWRNDTQPSAQIELCRTGFSRNEERSYVVVCPTENGCNVWVAFTQLPVRVYHDNGQRLELRKDFYRVPEAQRCLGFDRLQVDPQTETAFVLDAHDALWKLADWRKPRFVKLPVKTASVGLDARGRHLFARTLYDGGESYSVGKIARFELDGDRHDPVNYGATGTNRVTEKMQYEWCFEGNSDKGIAVAPNGNVALVGMPRDGLRVFAGREDQVPWPAVKVADLPLDAGGVQFDLAGNLYVGYVGEKPVAPLPGFENDPFMSKVGRIHKYAPTGKLESGNLFPQPPAGPVHTYDVAYGAFQTQCGTRSPRFSVDAYGRIYFPTNIAARVTVIDNAGNEILHFGTYGNRDSRGGLPGDQVPTRDIPMAFPNSVAATDGYIYVADMVNLQLLRLKKEFQLEAASAAGVN